jgi:membrane protein
MGVASGAVASDSPEPRLDGRLDRRLEADQAKAQVEAEAALRRHPRVAKAGVALRAVIHQQSTEQVGLAASGAAFWLVISAFPTGAAVVSVFGLIVSPAQVANDLGGLARAAPSSLGSLITEQLRRVAAADRTGLSIGLAVSVVVAIWSASAGVYNLDRAIRYSFGMARQRYVEARARALGGAGIVVVALGALALGASLVAGRAPVGVVLAIGVPAVLVALVAAIATMYRFSIGPTVPARRHLPGALGAAVAVVGSLAAFTAYLGVSSRFAASYGAFAGLVIGMFGLYLAVYAVLLGAVYNANRMARPVDRPNA